MMKYLEDERTIPLSRYQEDGYDNRTDYLIGLAKEHELTLEDILPSVDLMGPEEDFDGTVNFVEDYASMMQA